MSYGVIEREQPARLRDREEKPHGFGTTREVWLFLLREGGHWSAAEIAKCLGRDASRIKTMPDNMHRSRSITRRDKTDSPRSRVRYGVSAGCTIPQGVTVREVVELAKVRGE